MGQMYDEMEVQEDRLNERIKVAEDKFKEKIAAIAATKADKSCLTKARRPTLSLTLIPTRTSTAHKPRSCPVRRRPRARSRSSSRT